MTNGQGAWDPADGSAPYAPAPKVPPPRPANPPSPEPTDAADDPAANDWWRYPDVRQEWQDAWANEAQEAREAAWEIGAQIGEAVAAHLPAPAGPPPTPAEQGWRGLDLRWMGLKYNIPGALLALLVTWRGQSGVDAMTRSVTEDGIFAPLGWLLLVFLVGLAVMVLPIGQVFANLVASIFRGLTNLIVRAWQAPYIGYLLRLLVAVAAWSFVIAVVRVGGRAAIHWMTGA
ncbi:hypothetical protein [Streptomyces chryseus]|uniref:Integral membrane protein n=2 Tax=Streptomyces chryseus TaxID=68186 RepID=A0ABQ3EDF7_9ACTN|nr:hypothetical protein [Streptomyces chryseus]GHB31210.1 hypothetical protein GCM10010346_63270 [Streptomyces chryseus]